MTTEPPILVVDHLSKCFEIFRKPTDLLLEILFRAKRHEEHWALRDVSFEVGRGEVVGIMGRNGAGKSTLLKVLMGTLAPTSGSARINGRVSGILELGTGFHPDYTGRQNILLGGMCLGMSREEVAEKTESIIAFSELARVIDQPFKTYSTGMQTRLTFATAAAVDPDVLVVDEALAVGDAKFQRKCTDHFRTLVGRGKTILLVSHNTSAVVTLCTRAVLLEAGALLIDDRPRVVANEYHRMLSGESGLGAEQAVRAARMRVSDRASSAPETSSAPGPAGAQEASSAPIAPKTSSAPGAPEPLRFGDGRVEIVDCTILGSDGRPTALIHPGEEVRFEMTAVCHQEIEDLAASFYIKDPRGIEIYGTDTDLLGMSIPLMQAGQVFRVVMEFQNRLGAGEYLLSYGMGSAGGLKYDYRHDAIIFRVSQNALIYHACKVDLDSKYRVELVGAPSL